MNITQFIENTIKKSIKQAKKEKKVYARLFIPYTINGFYVMGADKINNDYKLLVVEKWNTPFILKINYKEILLSELTKKYDSLTIDKEWKTENLSNIFNNVNNLYQVEGV